jgi:hypothetical protein
MVTRTMRPSRPSASSSSQGTLSTRQNLLSPMYASVAPEPAALSHPAPGNSFSSVLSGSGGRAAGRDLAGADVPRLLVEPEPRAQLAVEVALPPERQRPRAAPRPIAALGVEGVGVVVSGVARGHEYGVAVRVRRVGDDGPPRGERRRWRRGHALPRPLVPPEPRVLRVAGAERPRARLNCDRQARAERRRRVQRAAVS